ncbi:MAG: hypothetical protein ACOWWO_17105 [Peptococcaceae bacterium]
MLSVVSMLDHDKHKSGDCIIICLSRYEEQRKNLHILEKNYPQSDFLGKIIMKASRLIESILVAILIFAIGFSLLFSFQVNTNLKSYIYLKLLMGHMKGSNNEASINDAGIGLNNEQGQKITQQGSDVFPLKWVVLIAISGVLVVIRHRQIRRRILLPRVMKYCFYIFSIIFIFSAGFITGLLLYKQFR